MTSEEEHEITCEQEVEILKEEKKELQEALRKEIEFKTASTYCTQKLDIWIPAIDALSLFVKINEARRWAIDHNDPWRKLLFQIDEYGRVTSAVLEDIT